MMLAVCQENPKSDKFEFMLKYLEKKYGERATIGDKQNLVNMRNEVKRLEAILAEKKQNKDSGSEAGDHDKDKGSEHETEDEDEDDYVEILPEKLEQRKNKGPRQSVSAEAFGKFNKKEDFKARVIPKSQEAIAAIYDKINKSFMFSGLDDKEKKIVVDAMEEKKCFKKENIITQGEQGDSLYVVA